MRGQRTPAARRAEVVGIASVRGVRAASRQTGTPVATVSNWMHDPEFEQLRTRKKDEVAAEVWGAFQTGVRRIVELIPQTDDMTKVATATGILYDKFALMSGQATERTENRDIVDTLTDDESEALREAIERELSRVDAG